VPERDDLAGTAISPSRYGRQRVAIEHARDSFGDLGAHCGVALDHAREAGEHHSPDDAVRQRVIERDPDVPRPQTRLCAALVWLEPDRRTVAVAARDPVDHDRRVVEERHESATRLGDTSKRGRTQSYALTAPGHAAKHVERDVDAPIEDDGHQRSAAGRSKGKLEDDIRIVFDDDDRLRHADKSLYGHRQSPTAV